MNDPVRFTPRLDVSVVVPLLNEADNLTVLQRRVTATLEAMGVSFELLLVDDGSADDSLDILQQMAASDARVGVIELAKNYGQHSAIMAGLRTARGAAVITMDADLQSPPEAIPDLIAALRHGYDLVCADFHSRYQPWGRRCTSMLAHLVMQRALQLPRGVRFSCFRALDRQLVDRLIRFTGTPVQLETLIRRCTNRIGMVPVDHAERHAGSTKYTLSRRLGFALNLFVRLPQLTFRVLLGIGVVVAALGAAGTLALGILAVLGGAGGGTVLVAGVFPLGGLILAGLGVVGECVEQVRTAAAREPQYLIRARYGGAAAEGAEALQPRRARG